MREAEKRTSPGCTGGRESIKSSILFFPHSPQLAETAKWRSNAFRQQKPHRQFEIVSRCAHNDCQAAAIDAYLKWFLNRQVIFALLLLILMLVRHLHIHHTLRIKLRTPEARNGHLFSTPLF